MKNMIFIILLLLLFTSLMAFVDVAEMQARNREHADALRALIGDDPRIIIVEGQLVDPHHDPYYVMELKQLPDVPHREPTQEEIEAELRMRTAAPPAPVLRGVAEFDENESVLIARHPAAGWGVGFETIAQMSQHINVIIVIRADQDAAHRPTILGIPGINLSNVQFFNPPMLDTYWTRDWGPLYSFMENGQLLMIDYVYTRATSGPSGRPNDDAVNPLLAEFIGLPRFHGGLRHEGGNHMVDGRPGGLFASTHIINAN